MGFKLNTFAMIEETETQLCNAFHNHCKDWNAIFIHWSQGSKNNYLPDVIDILLSYRV